MKRYKYKEDTKLNVRVGEVFEFIKGREVKKVRLVEVADVGCNGCFFLSNGLCGLPEDNSCLREEMILRFEEL